MSCYLYHSCFILFYFIIFLLNLLLFQILLHWSERREKSKRKDFYFLSKINNRSLQVFSVNLGQSCTFSQTSIYWCDIIKIGCRINDKIIDRNRRQRGCGQAIPTSYRHKLKKIRSAYQNAFTSFYKFANVDSEEQKLRNGRSWKKI